MTSKVVLSILIIISIFLVGYYFYGQKTVKTTPVSQSTNTNNPTTLTYPISPDKVGVRAVLIVYDFFGKVVKIEQQGSNTKYTLDNSDSQNPAFVTESATQFFKANNSANVPPQPASINDVKEGVYVDFSMTYDPKLNTWDLRAVTIQPAPTPSSK